MRNLVGSYQFMCCTEVCGCKDLSLRRWVSCLSWGFWRWLLWRTEGWRVFQIVSGRASWADPWERRSPWRFGIEGPGTEVKVCLLGLRWSSRFAWGFHSETPFQSNPNATLRLFPVFWSVRTWHSNLQLLSTFLTCVIQFLLCFHTDFRWIW